MHSDLSLECDFANDHYARVLELAYGFAALCGGAPIFYDRVVKVRGYSAGSEQSQICCHTLRRRRKKFQFPHRGSQIRKILRFYDALRIR